MTMHFTGPYAEKWLEAVLDGWYDYAESKGGSLYKIVSVRQIKTRDGSIKVAFNMLRANPAEKPETAWVFRFGWGSRGRKKKQKRA